MSNIQGDFNNILNTVSILGSISPQIRDFQELRKIKKTSDFIDTELKAAHDRYQNAGEDIEDNHRDDDERYSLSYGKSMVRNDREFRTRLEYLRDKKAQLLDRRFALGYPKNKPITNSFDSDMKDMEGIEDWYTSELETNSKRNLEYLGEAEQKQYDEQMKTLGKDGLREFYKGKDEYDQGFYETMLQERAERNAQLQYIKRIETLYKQSDSIEKRTTFLKSLPQQTREARQAKDDIKKDSYIMGAEKK
jgi:hypothetical protein